MSEANQITALTNLKTLGVSLVQRGANKKTVAFAKSETPVNIKAVIKNLVEKGELQDEKKVDETLKAVGLSDKGAEAIKAALKILEGFSEEPGMGDAIEKLAGLTKQLDPSAADEKKDPAAVQPPTPAADGEPKKDEEMSKETPVAKAEKVPAELEKLWKSSQEEVKKAHDEIASLKQVIKSETDARLTREWVAKAEKDLKFVAGKTATELGALLKSVEEKMGTEAAQAHFDLLKSTSDSVAKSELLSARGQGNVQKTNSAWDEINAKANDMVAKSTDGKLKQHHAIDLVMKQHPELYTRYLNEDAKK